MSRFDLLIIRLGTLISLMLIVSVFLSSCKTTGLTAEQQIRQLNKMSWMVGNWQEKEGGTTMREEWTRINDTLYSAVSLLIIEEDTVFREEISIKPGKRNIYYNVFTLVNDKPQYSSFVLMKNSSRSFVVEDLKNIEMSRITYKNKSNSQIYISTEGKENGKTVRESYGLTKVQ